MNNFPASINEEISRGRIDYINEAIRSRTGLKITELKIFYPDGNRKLFVIRDLGSRVEVEEIILNNFMTRSERNNEKSYTKRRSIPCNAIKLNAGHVTQQI